MPAKISRPVWGIVHPTAMQTARNRGRGEDLPPHLKTQGRQQHMTRRRGMSLAGQYLRLQLLIVLAVLVAVVAISLAQSAATFDRSEGRRRPADRSTR